MNKTLIIIALVALIGVVIYMLMTQSSNKISETQKTIPQAMTPSVSPVEGNPTSSYSLSDVSSHNSETSCWTTIDNKVYDVTTFIKDHPGGREILEACGRDATRMFQRVREHDPDAFKLLPTFYIGDLK